MGDLHNLFGRVHESEVLLDEEGHAGIRNLHRGELAAETLCSFGYREADLVDQIGGRAGAAGRTRGDVPGGRGALDRGLPLRLRGYTYLD